MRDVTSDSISAYNQGACARADRAAIKAIRDNCSTASHAGGAPHTYSSHCNMFVFVHVYMFTYANDLSKQ